MAMGMVYLIGVPMVVMAALGFWALFQRNERFAILLAAAAVVPLAVFIGFNLLGKDTHVRYTFVALFAWLALAAIGIEVTVAALRSRWGNVVSALPGLALLATFALADYIYMTGGAGYRPLWREAMAYVEAHRRPGELVGGDWAAHRVVQYYLGEPDAVLLPHGFSDEDMRELVPRPAWILLQAYHPSSGDRTEQLSAAGALQAYFTNRVAQPNHTINVYYYAPPGAGAKSDAAVGGAKHSPRGPPCVERGDCHGAQWGQRLGSRSAAAFCPKVAAGWCLAGSWRSPLGRISQVDDRRREEWRSVLKPMTSARGHLLSLYACGPKV